MNAKRIHCLIHWIEFALLLFAGALLFFGCSSTTPEPEDPCAELAATRDTLTRAYALLRWSGAAIDGLNHQLDSILALERDQLAVERRLRLMYDASAVTWRDVEVIDATPIGRGVIVMPAGDELGQWLKKEIRKHE